MITCPSCQHKEMYGTLFCSECGTQLTNLKPSPAKTAIYPGEAPVVVNKPIDKREIPQKPSSEPQTDAFISLKVLENGTIIPLEGGLEFTLGRVSGNQPILPDIDLTPYRAYEGGVSRLHATIKIEKQAVTVTDLGSANGTQVNGRRIAPHTQQSLKNEDVLTLGKFKIQVLFHF